MTKLKKIAAAIAVAASIGSIGLVSYAATPRNQITPNEYCTFEWGAGYAKVTNNTETKRYAYAAVTVYKDVTGEQVDYLYDNGSIGFHQSVNASSTAYSSNGYNFKCVGGMHSDGTSNSPLLWSATYNVQ